MDRLVLAVAVSKDFVVGYNGASSESWVFWWFAYWNWQHLGVFGRKELCEEGRNLCDLRCLCCLPYSNSSLIRSSSFCFAVFSACISFLNRILVCKRNSFIFSVTVWNCLRIESCCLGIVDFFSTRAPGPTGFLTKQFVLLYCIRTKRPYSGFRS